MLMVELQEMTKAETVDGSVSGDEVSARRRHQGITVRQKRERQRQR